MVVDYRTLNKLTARKRWPSPLTDDQLDKLKGKIIYTLLDLVLEPLAFSKMTQTKYSKLHVHFLFGTATSEN